MSSIAERGYCDFFSQIEWSLHRKRFIQISLVYVRFFSFLNLVTSTNRFARATIIMHSSKIKGSASGRLAIRSLLHTADSILEIQQSHSEPSACVFLWPI